MSNQSGTQNRQARDALLDTSVPPDRLIREPECRKITGLSRVSRWRLEQENEFPHRVQITSHSIGWRLSEVMAWLESRPRIKRAQATVEAEATA